MVVDMNKLKELENTEPKIEKDWVCEGFRCVVIFHGHRCGYVGIPRNHPAFGKSYDDIPISVHGGLTYGSDELKEVKKDKGVFWFGFDCAHSGDSTLWHKEEKGHFWTKEEVAKECEDMAKQFKKMTLKDIVKYKLEYMPDWFKDNVVIKIRR